MTGVRLAHSNEFVLLQEIEHASDALFADAGMPEIYEMGNVMELVELQAAHTRKHLWVATEQDMPIGWAMAEPIDAGLHLEQLCVHPNYGRRGHGRALFEACLTEAGVRRVTLSTFRDVPWNAPLYERWGFRIVSAEEMTTDLDRIQADERSRGLVAPRVVMIHERANG